MKLYIWSPLKSPSLEVSICNLIRSVNNGELLSLIHYNIIVSVPMGIYYQSILICLVLSQFTYSNYALCYFYRNTCFFDLDLVEDSLYSLSLVSRFNTQLPFYQTKSPHRTKKRRHLFWTAVRRQKHFLLPFLSCGIPEAGGWWQRGGRISSFFFWALWCQNTLCSVNHPAISFTTQHSLCCSWAF